MSSRSLWKIQLQFVEKDSAGAFSMGTWVESASRSSQGRFKRDIIAGFDGFGDVCTSEKAVGRENRSIGIFCFLGYKKRKVVSEFIIELAGSQYGVKRGEHASATENG